MYIFHSLFRHTKDWFSELAVSCNMQNVTARRTRDFPISYFLTIRARAECVLRIRIMCTHATARAIKCSPDRFTLFVSAEDERTPKRREAMRSCCRGRTRRTNCSAHARLNDHCMISRCERVDQRRQPTRNIAFPRARIARRFTAAGAMLSAPIAFSGARWNSWFSTSYSE